MTGAVVLAALLNGCAPNDDAGDTAVVDRTTAVSESVDLDALDEHRTDYLGDNSSVLALVGATSPEMIGDSSVELHTETQPYTLTVTFSSVEAGVSGAESREFMADRAVLLLATIGNVEVVRWELGGGYGVVSRGMADEQVGESVAELGATREGLETLAGRLG